MSMSMCVCVCASVYLLHMSCHIWRYVCVYVCFVLIAMCVCVYMYDLNVCDFTFYVSFFDK